MKKELFHLKTMLIQKVYKLQSKKSVKAATSSTITLNVNSFPNTLDTVSLSIDDRILIKDADDAKDNGIYVVKSDNGDNTFTIERAEDANSDDEVKSGLYCLVNSGTNSGKGFILITPNPISLGNTNLEFTQFTTYGDVNVDNDTLIKSGDNVSIQLADSSLELTTGGLKVADSSFRNTIISLDDTPNSYPTNENYGLVYDNTSGLMLSKKIKDNIIDFDDTPSSLIGLSDLSLVVDENSGSPRVIISDPAAQIKSEIDNTESGFGLNDDGSYSPPDGVWENNIFNDTYFTITRGFLYR